MHVQKKLYSPNSPKKPREIPKHQKYTHTVNPYIKDIHILLFLERKRKVRERKRGLEREILERESENRRERERGMARERERETVERGGRERELVEREDREREGEREGRGGGRRAAAPSLSTRPGSARPWPSPTWSLARPGDVTGGSADRHGRRRPGGGHRSPQKRGGGE